MIRRDFLKTTALGIVAIGIPKIVNSPSEDIGDTIEYKGFKLRWSGFIAKADSERVHCRWISWYQSKDTNCPTRAIYANTPGEEGIAFVGAIFFMGIMKVDDRFSQILNIKGDFQPAFLEEYFLNKDLAQKVKLYTLARVKMVIDNLEEYERKSGIV